MKNDKISERLDEHEKRIFFNNSFAKNKTDELQTSLSELETAVETATTSIETIQTELGNAQTSLSELETLTQNHTSEIADLTTETETNTANITTLQTDLTTAETNITNLQTAQNATQTALDTAEDTITDHETRITALENSAPLPEYYGRTIEEISALESDVLDNEIYNHNGGTFKFTVGSKSPNGPYGSIFTRINPSFSTEFVGSIKLYLYNVPAGQTTTSLNLTINGTTTALTPSINTTDNTITLPFDINTGSVFNRFDIACTDPLLAETFLDYLEITATQGANFACMNKDYAYLVFNYISENNKEYNFVARNEGHNHSYRFYKDDNTLGTTGFTDASTLTCSLKNITYNITNIKAVVFYQYIPNTHTYVIRDSFYLMARADSDDKGLWYDKLFNRAYVYISNVYDISYSYNGITTWKEFCGTTYDFRPFIGKDTPTFSEEVTISSNNIPQEFIVCTPPYERRLVVSGCSFLSGYLLQHKSGEIIHIPAKNSNYFIKLGKGVEPKGYVQAGRTEINVYYQNFQKTNVIKRVLRFNSQTDKWELDSTKTIYPNIQEIHEYGENQMYVKQNGVWTLMAKY